MELEILKQSMESDVKEIDEDLDLDEAIGIAAWLRTVAKTGCKFDKVREILRKIERTMEDDDHRTSPQRATANDISEVYAPPRFVAYVEQHGLRT